ncbi:MAG: TM2 domain-containing protein [Clostridiales bacterium]|nr:TM2 domain-containing protein [Clostridiales bacterium]
MFCKNCGSAMDNLAAVCVNCGAPTGAGNQFCPNCGKPTPPNAAFCTTCGVALNNMYAQNQGGVNNAKSKMAAGLLAIFLGTLGIHNFYLGYTTKAVIQLVVSLVLSWTVIVPIGIWIWAIVEAVQIFSGKIPDANGVPLKD